MLSLRKSFLQGLESFSIQYLAHFRRYCRSLCRSCNDKGVIQSTSKEHDPDSSVLLFSGKGFSCYSGSHGHDRMVVEQLPMQSVPIITDIVNLNLDQGEVYNFM